MNILWNEAIGHHISNFSINYARNLKSFQFHTFSKIYKNRKLIIKSQKLSTCIPLEWLFRIRIEICSYTPYDHRSNTGGPFKKKCFTNRESF